MANFSETILQTSRLLLRPLRPSDAAAVFALRSDPKVARYAGYIPWTSIESARTMIERDMNWLATGENIRLGIVGPHGDEVIGTCTLFHLDEQCRRADIGYDLCPAFWGHGFINEALTALIQYGFSSMQLNRLEADVDPSNMASIKVLERLGFQREGFMRERWIVNGVKSDTAFYGLLLSDWLTRAAT